MISIEILEFVTSQQITIEQFLLLQSVYAKQTGEKRYSVHANMYEEYRKVNAGKIPFRNIAIELIERGFLTVQTKKEQFKIKDLRATEKFYEAIYVDEVECFKEALDCYPDYIDVNGTKHLSKIHKNGVDFLRKKYYEKVTKNGSKKEHNAFVKLISMEYKGKKVAQQKFDYLIDNWELLKPQFLKKHRSKLIAKTESYERQR